MKIHFPKLIYILLLVGIVRVQDNIVIQVNSETKENLNNRPLPDGSIGGNFYRKPDGIVGMSFQDNNQDGNITIEFFVENNYNLEYCLDPLTNVTFPAVSIKEFFNNCPQYRVGINTREPLCNLDVHDDLCVRGDLTVAGTIYGSVSGSCSRCSLYPHCSLLHQQQFYLPPVSNITTVDFVIAGRGGGAITRSLDESAEKYGSCRGYNAIDFQFERENDTQVAFGDYSVILNGRNNEVSGDSSIVLLGNTNEIQVFANYSSIFGDYNLVQGFASYQRIFGYNYSLSNRKDTLFVDVFGSLNSIQDIIIYGLLQDIKLYYALMKGDNNEIFIDALFGFGLETIRWYEIHGDNNYINPNYFGTGAPMSYLYISGLNNNAYGYFGFGSIWQSEGCDLNQIFFAGFISSRLSSILTTSRSMIIASESITMTSCNYCQVSCSLSSSISSSSYAKILGGSNNVISNSDYSIVEGSQNSLTNSDYGKLFGQGLLGNSVSHRTVIGRYNTGGTNIVDCNNFSSQIPLFTAGFGASSGSRVDVFDISRAGDICVRSDLATDNIRGKIWGTTVNIEPSISVPTKIFTPQITSLTGSGYLLLDRVPFFIKTCASSSRLTPSGVKTGLGCLDSIASQNLGVSGGTTSTVTIDDEGVWNFVCAVNFQTSITTGYFAVELTYNLVPIARIVQAPSGGPSTNIVLTVNYAVTTPGFILECLEEQNTGSAVQIGNTALTYMSGHRISKF